MAFSISALASSTVLRDRSSCDQVCEPTRVAARGDLPEDFRIVGGVLADREERRLDALVGQRLEHGRRGRPGAVVEGQHHFLVAQEVVLAEMLEAEARTAGGVDLDRAGDAERVGIVALGRGFVPPAAGAAEEPARALRRGRRAGAGAVAGASGRSRTGPAAVPYRWSIAAPKPVPGPATDAEIAKANAAAPRIHNLPNSRK